VGRKLGAAAWVAAGALVVAMIAGGHWLGRLTTGGGLKPEPRAAASPGPSPSAMVPPGPRLSPPAPRPAAVRPLNAAMPVIGPYGIRQATGTANVALTFDDGPDPRWTPAVLDLLRYHGISATFCLIGVNVQAYPDLVRRIVSEGHTLCNHSWAHEIGLGTRSPEAIRANLMRVNDEIHKALPGVAIPYFRQPGGAWTTRAVQVAKSLGMASIHWDVDPQDWRRPGAVAIAKFVNGGTRPGSIVLLHDGGGDRSGTVAACRFFLPYLRGRFSLVALPTPPVNGIGRGRYQLAD
jgi:peptidoglycan/xylan/chitin deacetylase (PgdA/CDA1 family)